MMCADSTDVALLATPRAPNVLPQVGERYFAPTISIIIAPHDLVATAVPGIPLLARDRAIDVEDTETALPTGGLGSLCLIGMIGQIPSRQALIEGRLHTQSFGYCAKTTQQVARQVLRAQCVVEICSLRSETNSTLPKAWWKVGL